MKAERQPKFGEIVLMCAHVLDFKHCHWFNVPESQEFTRPDGTIARAQWMAVCNSCALSNPRAVITKDVIWGTDDANIQRTDVAEA